MIDFEQIDSGHSDAKAFFDDAKAFFDDIKTVTYQSKSNEITVKVCRDYDFHRKKDLKDRGLVFAEINFKDDGKRRVRRVLREYFDQDIFEYQEDSFFEQVIDIVNENKYF
jgi:hypothetical protein